MLQKAIARLKGCFGSKAAGQRIFQGKDSYM
jgi:hypothetical protein